MRDGFMSVPAEGIAVNWPKPKVHIDLKCIGTAAKCLGAEVMGIDAQFIAAEKKPAVIEFIKPIVC